MRGNPSNSPYKHAALGRVGSPQFYSHFRFNAMNYEKYPWMKPSPPVLECNGYKFNKSEVCLNPDAVLIPSKATIELTITVAESPIGWVTGYKYQRGRYSSGFAGCASGSPCYAVRGLPDIHIEPVTYSTKEEAIRGQLKRLMKYWRQDEDLVDAARAYLAPKTMQLF